jgi:SulP family sulfate permease
MWSIRTRLKAAGIEKPAGELWGGFAAMLVALPAALAYGLAIFSPLGTAYVAQGAMAGIVGAIALGIVAPVFGGAPRLISAPCAPAAAFMAALAGELANQQSGGKPIPLAEVVTLLTVAAMVTGLLQLLYGTAGGGRLIKYIPYPVVSGYLGAVGMLIIIGQAPELLGLPKGLTVGEGVALPEVWLWPGLVVGVVTMVGMVFGPKLTRAAPAVILGLLAGVLAYWGMALVLPELRHLAHNKLVIGQLGGGAGSLLAGLSERWRSVTGLRLDELRPLLAPALTLSVLLSIDTLKTCVVMDALTRSRHNSNRELRGQGLGNLASALLGGVPGAGMMGPTLVNVLSGGRTRLSSVLAGVFALVALLLLRQLLAWVPVAALAGILMVVGARMFDRGSLHLLKHKSTVLDFSVIVAVMVAALWYNLMIAAGVGLVLAILLFMREQMRGSVIRRKVYGDKASSKQHRLPKEKEALRQRGRATTICELQGSLFFGTTDRLFTELEADLKTCRYLILDLRRVQSVDFTAAHLLEQIEAMLAERQAYLLFSNLPPTLPTGQDLEVFFGQMGLVKTGRNVKVFDSLDDALEWTEDRILEEAGLVQNNGETPLALAQIELMREFEADHTLAALQTCVEKQSFAAGETVFKQGDPGDELYLIRRGSVRLLIPLEHGRHFHVATFGRGSFFGDMAFLDPGLRSAEAVAVSDTDLFLIRRQRFNQVVLEHPLVGVKVFARLARALAVRLRHTDDELRVLEEC